MAELDIAVTFAIVQVHVDGLALAEGAEGHHVFMRVEGDAVESHGVAELSVDRHLVAWRGPNTSGKLSETYGKQSVPLSVLRTPEFSPVSVFQT